MTPPQLFLNCPFDLEYRPIFDAIVFVATVAGFRVRCALEADDSSEVRYAKILRMIRACDFAIHDVSRTELDPANKLPRFNMPLELGLFLGCKEFGGAHHRDKRCLVLDTDRYRYQKFISDIAGQDVLAHGGTPKGAVSAVRRWLRGVTHQPISGEAVLWASYQNYRDALPRLAAANHLTPDELTFTDSVFLITRWLQYQ